MSWVRVLPSSLRMRPLLEVVNRGRLLVECWLGDPRVNTLRGDDADEVKSAEP